MVDILQNTLFATFGSKVAVSHIDNPDGFEESAPPGAIFPRIPFSPVAILSHGPETELVVEREGAGHYILFRGVGYYLLRHRYGPLFARPVFAYSEDPVLDRFAELFNVWRSAALDLLIAERFDERESRLYALHAANEARLVFWRHSLAGRMGVGVQDHPSHIYAMASACCRAACGIEGNDEEMARWWRAREPFFDPEEVVGILRHAGNPAKAAADWFNEIAGIDAIHVDGEGDSLLFFNGIHVEAQGGRHGASTL